MALEDDLTVGELVATYRLTRRLSAQDLAKLLGNWHPTALSRLEHGSGKRPDRATLRQLADIFHLTELQYTTLLRAADHAPTADEIATARNLAAPILVAYERAGVEALLLDYRGFCWAWNALWARAALPLPPPLPALLHEGMPPAALAAGAGVHLLQCICDPRAGLRRTLEGVGRPHWRTVLRFALGRFWCEARRLLNEDWGPSPAWLTQLTAALETLPDPGVAEVRAEWSAARTAFLDPTSPHDAFYRTAPSPFSDGVYAPYHDGALVVRASPEPLQADGRFLLITWCDGRGPAPD